MPAELVEQARLAEEAGFDALWVSDHFHPWNDEQGQSAFVWSVIGAISQACSLPVTTAVTCPTVRVHPAVIAQAAATSAVLLNGRFTLGVGSGEALNEHITATHGRRRTCDWRCSRRPWRSSGCCGPARRCRPGAVLHAGQRPDLHDAGGAAPLPPLRSR